MDAIVRTVIKIMAMDAMAPAIGKKRKPETQCLRHGTDQIDRIVADECEHRTGAENERQGDHRRSDHDRAPDIARGRARFAGENRDVFESAEGADREFGENVDAIKDATWSARRVDERMIMLSIRRAPAAMNGNSDQRRINHQHGKATDVVHPFA